MYILPGFSAVVLRPFCVRHLNNLFIATGPEYQVGGLSRLPIHLPKSEETGASCPSMSSLDSTHQNLTITKLCRLYNVSVNINAAEQSV